MKAGVRRYFVRIIPASRELPDRGLEIFLRRTGLKSGL